MVCVVVRSQEYIRTCGTGILFGNSRYQGFGLLSYSQDSPAVSKTDLRTAFSSEGVHNFCSLLFAPATDPASKLKPRLIT